MHDTRTFREEAELSKEERMPVKDGKRREIRLQRHNGHNRVKASQSSENDVRFA